MTEPEAWIEDLEFLRREFPARHKNAFHTLAHSDFQRGIDDLVAHAPGRRRHENIVGLAALLARVGDGHSGIDLQDTNVGFHRLPVKLYFYREGLFVREARPALAGLAAARVLAIGGVDPDTAVARAGALANHDNGMGVMAAAPKFLGEPEVLSALGLSTSTASATFDFELADGTPRSAELESDSEVEAPYWTYGGSGSETPLWRRHRDLAYWFELLYEKGMAYAQLNRVVDDPTERFGDFCARLWAAVEANDITRLVIDLRLNRGGNGYLNQVLVHGIIRSRLNERGRLFVITGRETFSAALMCTVDLERETQAIFVGEPTGGKPNHFSESGRFTLPNSGIPVGYSWLYWQLSDARDDRPWIQPHIEAEVSSAADFAGDDPAMEAILRAIEEGRDFTVLPSNRLRWRESAGDFQHHYDPVLFSQEVERLRRTGALGV
jgi:hypothetical protein